MIEPSDIDSAGELLGVVHGWSIPNFAVVAETVALLRHAGAPLPAGAPPGAGRLRELLEGDPGALDGLESPVLEELDGCVGHAMAAELADRLHDRGVLPAWWRLPRLLAAGDADRQIRLVADANALVGRQSAPWAACVTETYLAALDGGQVPPASVEEEFRLLTSEPAASIEDESYQARLRLAARRDARGALPLLEEAVSNVGHDAVDVGLEAVLGRLAGLDRAALARHLCERTYTLDEKAASFRASLWEHPEPADRETLLGLADELERDIASRGLFPRELWAATFDLLAAAARLGEPEMAARVIRFAGPPEWTILNATSAPTHKRAASGDAAALSFLPRLASVLPFAGQGRASIDPTPPPGWAFEFPAPLRASYWRLRALPVAGMPWWQAWDGGLP